MNLRELSAHVAAEFKKIYGRPPRWIVAAPGRVNVIGEHTDYNDGFVLPMAIEFYGVLPGMRITCNLFTRLVNECGYAFGREERSFEKAESGLNF